MCVRFGPISNHFGHKLIIMYHSFFVLVFSLLFNAILTITRLITFTRDLDYNSAAINCKLAPSSEILKDLLFLVFFLEEKQEEEAEETLYRNNNNKVTTIIIIIKNTLLNLLQKYYNSRGKMM